jgi:hypothetical protein
VIYERPAFEHSNLGALGLDVDAHEVPAERLTAALAPPPA